MKLTFVKFKALERFEDGGTTDEVRATPERPIEWSREDQVVKIGKDVFPLSHVRRMLTAPVECPECHQTFDDERALGAHRAYTHKVPGARNKTNSNTNTKESK